MEVTVGGQLEGSDSRDRRSMRLVEYLVCYWSAPGSWSFLGKADGIQLRNSTQHAYQELPLE